MGDHFEDLYEREPSVRREDIFRCYLKARLAAGYSGSIYLNAHDPEFLCFVESGWRAGVDGKREHIILPIRRYRPPLVLVCGEDY